MSVTIDNNDKVQNPRRNKCSAVVEKSLALFPGLSGEGPKGLQLKTRLTSHDCKIVYMYNTAEFNLCDARLVC